MCWAHCRRTASIWGSFPPWGPCSICTVCGAGPRPLLMDEEWHPKPHQHQGDFCQKLETSMPAVALKKILCQKDQHHSLHIPPAQHPMSFHLSGIQVIKKNEVPRINSKLPLCTGAQPEVESGLHFPLDLRGALCALSVFSHESVLLQVTALTWPKNIFSLELVLSPDSWKCVFIWSDLSFPYGKIQADKPDSLSPMQFRWIIATGQIVLSSFTIW